MLMGAKKKTAVRSQSSLEEKRGTGLGVCERGKKTNWRDTDILLKKLLHNVGGGEESNIGLCESLA